MPTRKPGGFASTQHLTQLLQSVTVARSCVETARARQAGRHAMAVSAQRDLLLALEDYVTALESAGKPVPYRLRDELHLYRRLDLSG